MSGRESRRMNNTREVDVKKVSLFVDSLRVEHNTRFLMKEVKVTKPTQFSVRHMQTGPNSWLLMWHVHLPLLLMVQYQILRMMVYGLWSDQRTNTSFAIKGMRSEIWICLFISLYDSRLLSGRFLMVGAHSLCSSFLTGYPCRSSNIHP
jgi:hypothetical protein